MKAGAMLRADGEIDQHSLLTEGNAFLPAFCLPTEILEDIFTYGVRDYYEREPHPSFHVPDWVNFSYICRHWRDVALNCPVIWSYHFTVSLRWTDELLARSQQASLRIRIKYDSLRPGSWWLDLLEKVLSHTERIQELRIHVPTRLFPTKLSLYAPRLQVLDIGLRFRSPIWSLAIEYGDIPPLHTLKLTECPLPSHSLNLNRITTLSLCRVPAQDTAEFLTTLNRMQAITDLHLEQLFISAYVFPSGGVSLPNLARLFVLTGLSTVVKLLSCINIPLKTHVGLEIIGEDNSSIDDFAQLLPLFAQRFSQSRDFPSLGPTIRSLVVRSSQDQSTFAVGASDCSDCAPDMSPRECKAPLMIHVRSKLYIIDMHHILSDICCCIPPTHVQTLHAVYPPLPTYFWKKTLGHFRGLRHMKLSDGFMPCLVSLLALPAEPLLTPEGHVTSDHVLTRSHEFVPALEELELCCIRFWFMDGDGVSEESLLDALSTRKAQLTMIDCVEEDELDSIG